MRRRLDAGRTDGLHRFVYTASTSAKRCAALINRLLVFARRHPLDIKPVDVNVLITSMDDLLRQTLDDNTTFKTMLKAGLWPAPTDANQLESAILNLVINARDAMAEGGQLTIETANTYFDGTQAHAGDYVVISVSDTGRGMPADVIAKAFDPFFTTKPIGQGSGLGLSIIHGFVNQSGGHVTIDSEVGNGTTVKLYLPRAMEDAERRHKVPDVCAHGRGETVLVVEDDASVRSSIAELLHELGYRSAEASDPRMALPLLESALPIDLLVTDLSLPNMSGRQLAGIARRLRPGLKVLLVSGYAEGTAVRSAALPPGMDMMTKPFDLITFGAKIRDLIES